MTDPTPVDPPHVVIVGAGLGGCVLAHRLAATHRVTVVELGSEDADIASRLRDTAWPARLDPHIGSGVGGTTALWHNALIEIDESVFQRAWPLRRETIAPWYEEAFPLLSDGCSRAQAHAAGAALRARYLEAGMGNVRHALQFIPNRRRNLWDEYKLADRVELVVGEATGITTGPNGHVNAITVTTKHGDVLLSADAFVLAAGGLGTPALLQTWFDARRYPSIDQAGRHYEDHPMAFAGVLTLKAPLWKFWNHSASGLQATLRMPLVIEQDGLQISFQLRPAALLLNEGRRQAMGSALTALRNDPFNPANYVRVLRNPDDLLDILSFRFGIRLPTRHYSLLVVAEQPPCPERAIRAVRDPATGRPEIEREWQLSAEYLNTLTKAVDAFVRALGNQVVTANIFPQWTSSLATAAHHSGTARMSSDPGTGVVDVNCRVHGFDNLYVADGSLIPGSGIANTGLTIAALALRLADHLQSGARRAH